MRFLPIFLTIVVFATPVRFLAVNRADSAALGPTVKPEAPSESMRVVLDDMYNLRYQEARATLEPWAAKQPADLAALNTLAETIVDEEMLREGLFSSALYTNNGAGLRKMKRSFPPGFGKELGGILNRAEAAEQARLSRDPDDEEAIYWSGTTHRIWAEFDFFLAHSYLAGFHEGRAANRDERRLHSLDPAYVDALFIIGIYDYAAGSLPWYVKAFALLGGIHGNRQQGLAELKQVCEQGQWNSIDAQAVLVVLYRSEKKYLPALALLDELRRAFPEDFVAPLEIAGISEDRGDWRGAAELLDDTVAKLGELHTRSAEVLFPQALNADGQAHEKLGELEKALAAYERAASLTSPAHDPAIYRAALAAGRLCVRLNRSQEAQRNFELAQMAGPDTDEGRAAERALKSFH